VVHPDDREKVLEFMDDLSKIPNMKGAIECRYQCKDGNYKWIEIVVTNLIHDPDIQGFLGNYHDNTEHKNAEETLLKLKEKAEESDQLKSAFLANMSHEIRTPLNGIIGFIDLLQNPDLAENQRKQFAGLIKTSSDRLLTTITDIIAISKIESGQCELHSGQVDISALVHNLVDTYRFQLENRLVSLHVSQSIEADFRYIISDKMKLETILRHFINNAIKFTEKGSIEIGVKEKDEQIILYVFDTGIGISEDKKEIIFERFVQAQTGYEREYEGSGLGLSIAKAYAVLLGAKIWVESVVNKGSTFYLSVSRKVAVKQNSATGQVSIPVNKEAVMVLVVEDDKVSYLLLKEVLHNNGFVVKHAVNGLEAVKFMKDNPQTDIVLMDVKMPVMDGIEATIQIRQFNQDVPIIAQTAYALAEEMEKMERVGCNDYLTKPINSEVLLNCINENLYLAESRSR
jgi:signal transduction histidine kinase/CheY-like chemotaxis protein